MFIDEHHIYNDLCAYLAYLYFFKAISIKYCEEYLMYKTSMYASLLK